MRLSLFYPPPLLQRRLETAARRLRTGDGSPSIDGLDAAIRGFGVAMVVLLSLFGYGMPRLKGGGAGDQFVRVQITMPTGLGPREKALFQELKQLRSEN